MCPPRTEGLIYITQGLQKFNVSAFVYRLFYEDFSTIVGTNIDGDSTIYIPYKQQSVSTIFYLFQIRMQLSRSHRLF